MYTKIKYKDNVYVVYGTRTSGRFGTGADFLIYRDNIWQWINDLWVEPIDEPDEFGVLIRK